MGPDTARISRQTPMTPHTPLIRLRAPIRLDTARTRRQTPMTPHTPLIRHRAIRPDSARTAPTNREGIIIRPDTPPIRRRATIRPDSARTHPQATIRLDMARTRRRAPIRPVTALTNRVTTIRPITARISPDTPRTIAQFVRSLPTNRIFAAPIVTE
jgi:hypothetical protein